MDVDDCLGGEMGWSGVEVLKLICAVVLASESANACATARSRSSLVNVLFDFLVRVVLRPPPKAGGGPNDFSKLDWPFIWYR